MKKFIAFLLVIISIIVLIFLLKNDNEVTPKQDLTKTTKHFDSDLLSFDYPPDLDIELKTNGTDIAVFKKESNSNEDKALFNFFLLKVIDDKNLSVEDWWWNFGPQSESGSPTPDEKQSILKKIEDNEYYVTIYEIEGKPDIVYKFSPVNIYLINKERVFEIRTIKLPSSPEALSSLSAQEIETVREHEKVFWQVLETLRFK